MHEETFQQKPDLIVHDVTTLRINKTILQFLDSHFFLDILKDAQIFHVHEINQQFQEFVVVIDCKKTSDIHGLFQEDYGFMNESEIVDQQYGLPYQLELCHVFQD